MNEQRHLSAVPNRQPRRKPNYRVGLALSGLALVGGGIASRVTSHDEPKNTKKPQESSETICIPSKETHPYTFPIGEGQGVNHAVMDINGSGSGVGDECFDDAVAIVGEQLAKQDQYGQPRAQGGETIEIPDSIRPRTQTP